MDNWAPIASCFGFCLSLVCYMPLARSSRARGGLAYRATHEDAATRVQTLIAAA